MATRFKKQPIHEMPDDLTRPRAGPLLREILNNLNKGLLDLDSATDTSVSTSITLHSGLAGLLADDHPQYFLLAGRGTKQTARGGVGAGDALTLSSTNHGTKGKIFLGTAETTAFDEANTRLGIHTASPGAKLEIRQVGASAVARPSSTVAAGGMTGQDGGSSNLHNYINDVNDATWLVGAGSTANFGVVASDPGVDTGHVVRYRYRNNTTKATGINLQVELWQAPSTGIAAGTLHTDIPISSSWTQGSFTLTEAEAATITNYATLRIIISTGGFSGPPAEFPHVSEAWLELPGSVVDLARYYNTSSVLSSVMDSSGRMGILTGGASLAGSLEVWPVAAADRAIFVRGLTSQTGNLFEARNAADESLFRVHSEGRITINTRPSATSQGIALSIEDTVNADGLLINNLNVVPVSKSFIICRDLPSTRRHFQVAYTGKTTIGNVTDNPAVERLVLQGAGSHTADYLQLLNSSAVKLFGLDAAGRMDWFEAAEAAAPGAQRIRIWPEDRGGKTILNTVASDGIFQQLMRDNVAVMIADETVAKGDAVYMSATGATGVFGAVRKALASDAAKMPVVGVALEAITAGNKGRIMFSGLARLDTTGYAGAPADGATVYVDAVTAGRLTTVAPTHPNIRQAVGVIATHGAGNGRVEISPAAQIGTGFGTNENIWRIGDNTAGTKTLRYRNGFDLDLNAAPTAGRVITLPDATGTAALLERAQTFTRQQTFAPTSDESPINVVAITPSVGGYTGNRYIVCRDSPADSDGASLGVVFDTDLSSLQPGVEVAAIKLWDQDGIDGAGFSGIIRTDGPLTANRTWRFPNGSGGVLLRIGAVTQNPTTAVSLSGTLVSNVTGQVFIAVYAENTVAATGTLTISISYTNRTGSKTDNYITMDMGVISRQDKFASFRSHAGNDITYNVTKTGTGTYSFNIAATRP